MMQQLEEMWEYAQSIADDEDKDPTSPHYLGTEAIYAISNQLKPEAEQRFSIDFKNSSFQNFELNLGFEYRIANYVNDLAHEFFVITGANFIF